MKSAKQPKICEICGQIWDRISHCKVEADSLSFSTFLNKEYFT